jgi:ubiquinone/menaquinone biosynthesis C-methylase UbiE
MSTTALPNHHAHHPRFAGASGLLAALSMVAGRGSDARLAVRLAELKSGDTVIDIGCGPGAAARYAARQGASVIGVDPAAVMRRVARVLTLPFSRVRYVAGMAEHIPVPDASATVLWSIATVHHWQDVDAGLREARRVLQPGGRLVAIERRTTPGARGHASHGWTSEQAHAFADHCVAAGFEHPVVEENSDGHRATVSVRATSR